MYIHVLTYKIIKVKRKRIQTHLKRKESQEESAEVPQKSNLLRIRYSSFYMHNFHSFWKSFLADIIEKRIIMNYEE